MRSLPYLGARTSTEPTPARWTCRRTSSVRRRKSMSATCRPAASPSRSPAKAARATKARNDGSAAVITAPTCSDVGRAMAACRRRSRGSVTPSLGSTAITRSRTDGTQDCTDVVDARLDRARRQTIGVHALDPCLDVGSPQLREGKPPELGAPHGQAHRRAGVGLPQLTCRPLCVEVVQGDPAGLRVQVRAAQLVGLHGGQEALGVQLSGERLRSLTTRRVEIAGTPAVAPAVPVGPDLVASDQLLPAVFNVRHAWLPGVGSEGRTATRSRGNPLCQHGVMHRPVRNH